LIRRAFHEGTYGPLHYRIVVPRAPELRPPLFMFHMSPNSGCIFEAALHEMGKDRIVVAPDTPGFGESEAPFFPIEIEDFANAMSHLIDFLAEKFNFSQVDIMGYHTGAMTCIALALQRPVLVRRIVQISSPVFTDEELVSFRSEYQPKEICENGDHLRDAWLNLLRFYHDDVPRSVLARNFASSLRGGPIAHWGHRAAFNYDLKIYLPKVTQPLLIVNPNDDLAEQSPRALALVRHAKIVNIENHAHGFIDVIPVKFGEILRNFLDSAP